MAGRLKSAVSKFQTEFTMYIQVQRWYCKSAHIRREGWPSRPIDIGLIVYATSPIKGRVHCTAHSMQSCLQTDGEDDWNIVIVISEFLERHYIKPREQEHQLIHERCDESKGLSKGTGRKEW